MEIYRYAGKALARIAGWLFIVLALLSFLLGIAGIGSGDEVFAVFGIFFAIGFLAFALLVTRHLGKTVASVRRDGGQVTIATLGLMRPVAVTVPLDAVKLGPLERTKSGDSESGVTESVTRKLTVAGRKRPFVIDLNADPAAGDRLERALG